MYIYIYIIYIYIIYIYYIYIHFRTSLMNMCIGCKSIFYRLLILRLHMGHWENCLPDIVNHFWTNDYVDVSLWIFVTAWYSHSATLINYMRIPYKQTGFYMLVIVVIRCDWSSCHAAFTKITEWCYTITTIMHSILGYLKIQYFYNLWNICMICFALGLICIGSSARGDINLHYLSRSKGQRVQGNIFFDKLLK